MARIRTIKPEFWEDEKIAKLPMPCRLFYIGTWNFADDQGVFRGNPAILKSRIFPYDESLRVSEISKWLDALVEVRMLIPVSYNNESYYIIRAFQNHQKFDARYPNYLIPKEISDEYLNAENTPDEHPTSTQRVPSGTPTREREGEREIYRGNNNTAGENFIDEDPEFFQVVNDWLDYKKSRRESYKNQKSISAFISKLKNLSGSNPTVARMIIDESMANNWSGIFELKTSFNGTNSKSFSKSDRTKQLAFEAAEDLARRMAENQTGSS